MAGALRGFREGDKVKAYVLSIDNKRISLSLKPSHFTKEDLEEEEDEKMDDEEGSNGSDEEMDGSQHGFEGSEPDESEIGDDSDTDEDQEEMKIDLEQIQVDYPTRNPTERTRQKQSTSSQVPSLSLTGGFQWSGDVHDHDEDANSSSDEDDDEMGQSSKKKRKRKQIELDLTGDMHAKTPESNADFERLLLGSPNSSYLWIQYMSFQLPLSEVDKAREIARRAIKTINFREEKERLNIWIALLNLENVYGTEESLDAVFKEAARANDSKTVHLRLASIFEQSDKFEVSRSP